MKMNELNNLGLEELKTEEQNLTSGGEKGFWDYAYSGDWYSAFVWLDGEIRDA